MVDFVATGHSWSGGGGPITLAPLVGLLLTVVLARWFVGLRMSPMLLGLAVLLGALFAIAADTWGFTTSISAWVVLALILAGRVRHTRGTLGRNPSD
jgi:uncharacterized membrane protein YhfC